MSPFSKRDWRSPLSGWSSRLAMIHTVSDKVLEMNKFVPLVDHYFFRLTFFILPKKDFPRVWKKKRNKRWKKKSFIQIAAKISVCDRLQCLSPNVSPVHFAVNLLLHFPDDRTASHNVWGDACACCSHSHVVPSHNVESKMLLFHTGGLRKNSFLAFLEDNIYCLVEAFQNALKPTPHQNQDQNLWEWTHHNVSSVRCYDRNRLCKEGDNDWKEKKQMILLSTRSFKSAIFVFV